MLTDKFDAVDDLDELPFLRTLPMMASVRTKAHALEVLNQATLLETKLVVGIDDGNALDTPTRVIDSAAVDALRRALSESRRLIVGCLAESLLIDFLVVGQFALCVQDEADELRFRVVGHVEELAPSLLPTAMMRATGR